MLTNTERQQIVDEVNAGTYGIDEALDDIAAAQKGEEVRKALYAEALVLNREGHAGSTDMIARQQIANLQTSVNGQISTLRTEVGDDIDDLETALNNGLATQNGKIAAQNASIANVVANYNVEYGSTELWASTGETGALAAGTTVTLSEDVSHFDYIDIYSFCGNSNVLDTVPVDAKLQSSQGYALRWVNLSDPGSGSYKAYVRIIETRLHIIGTTLTIDHQVTYRNGEEVNISGAEITQANRSTYVGELGIMKIVGRKITANTEIEDVRIGADGTKYASAGQAVRGQITEVKAQIPLIDASLATAGKAADAKATGDAVAAVNGRLGDVKNTVDNLLYLPIDESEFIAEKYIWSDGKAYGNSTYTLSPYIRCAFRKIKFNCLASGSGVQCVAFYSDTSEESFISGYENTESLSTYPVHEMDVPDGTNFIRISKNAKSTITATVKPWVMSTESGESVAERIDVAKKAADEAMHKAENIDTSDILSDVYRPVYSDTNLIPSDGMLEHSFVDDAGTIKTTTNQSADAYNFVLSGYIPVEYEKTLYLSGDDFFYNRYFAWYDADKNYIGGKSLSGGMGFTAHVASVTVPNNATYLRITFKTAENAAVAWAGYTGTAPTGEEINATYSKYLDYHYYPKNPCDFIGRDVCTFNKILCIGDSITAGYFNHSGGGQTIAKYSYPAHLQKITGVECINMGDSGETSVSWWQTYQNTDFTGYDCAIINLGINDVLLSVPEADTRAALANIINAVKTANTGIKIFIANVVPAYARGNTTYDAINAIIEDIATSTENCYFIDLTQYGHAVGVAYANGHLTAVGYWMLAEDYANAISYIIRNNPEAFRFIQFIGTDLHD